LMNAGKVLACDEPEKLIEGRGAASLEDAFIGYMEDSIAKESAARTATAPAPPTEPAAVPAQAAAVSRRRSALEVRLGRLRAYARNETMQILRDPVRLAFAFIGSALLMLVFGFGITTDVEHIRFASFDLDQSPESRRYLQQFAGSPRYFADTAPALSADEALKRLQSDDVSV